MEEAKVEEKVEVKVEADKKEPDSELVEEGFGLVDIFGKFSFR